MLRIFCVIFAALVSTSASAFYDQTGFPARCAIASACEADTCIELMGLPFEVLVVEESGTYFVVSGETNRRIQVGYFDDISAARRFLAAGSPRDFGHFFTPNDELADAFGLDAYAVESTGNTTTVSPRMTKLVCSKIAKGLD